MSGQLASTPGVIALRARRVAAGLSADELARLSGCTGSSVLRYELGQSRPSVTQADRIAGVLGAGADELFAVVRPDPPPPVAPATDLPRWPLPPVDVPDYPAAGWAARAACAGMDVDLFYGPPRFRPPAEVVVACGSCPVRGDCAADAIRRGEPHGIWGGMGVEARARLRRALRRRAA